MDLGLILKEGPTSSDTHVDSIIGSTRSFTPGPPVGAVKPKKRKQKRSRSRVTDNQRASNAMPGSGGLDTLKSVTLVDPKKFKPTAQPTNAAEWDASKHPRGQPENAGEFASAPGGGSDHKGIQSLSDFLAANPEQLNFNGTPKPFTFIHYDVNDPSFGPSPKKVKSPRDLEPGDTVGPSLTVTDATLLADGPDSPVKVTYANGHSEVFPSDASVATAVSGLSQFKAQPTSTLSDKDFQAQKGLMVKLTNPQSDAISDYVGSGFQEINQYLRGLIDDEGNISYDDGSGEGDEIAYHSSVGQIKKIVRSLDAVMKKAPPLTAPLTVYRGLQNDHDWSTGDIIDDDAFVSTSREPGKAAEVFSGEDGTLISITIPVGARVLDTQATGFNSLEKEILLPRGSSFKITSSADPYGDTPPGGSSDSRRIVTAEYIPPPPPAPRKKRIPDDDLPDVMKPEDLEALGWVAGPDGVYHHPVKKAASKLSRYLWRQGDIRITPARSTFRSPLLSGIGMIGTSLTKAKNVKYDSDIRGRFPIGADGFVAGGTNSDGTTEFRHKLPDKKNVELISVDWLKKFRSHDRTFPEFVRDAKAGRLHQDAPLTLAWNSKRRRAWLINGNHRLNAAREVGIDKMPVVIDVDLEHIPKGMGKKSKRGLRGLKPDQYKPSDVFPGVLKKAAAPVDNAPPDTSSNGQPGVEQWIVDAFGTTNSRNAHLGAATRRNNFRDDNSHPMLRPLGLIKAGPPDEARDERGRWEQPAVGQKVTAETEKGTKLLVEVTHVEPHPSGKGWIVHGYRAGKSALKSNKRQTMYPNQYFYGVEKAWDSTKHPRGQPANAGEFASAPGAGDYHGNHTAPGPDYGDPMHALGSNVLPSDIYDQATQLQYYGTRDEASDKESFAALNRAKDKPDTPVAIYRAVPPDVNEINPGDWVTPSQTYANGHLQSVLNGEGHVITRTVPAKELYTNGDSINEWGWQPAAAPAASTAPTPPASPTHGVGVSDDPNSQSLHYIHQNPGESPADFHDRLFRDGQEHYAPAPDLESAASSYRDNLGLVQPRISDWTTVKAPLDRLLTTGEKFDQARSTPDAQSVKFAYKDLVRQTGMQWHLLTDPVEKGGLGVKVDFVTPDEIKASYGDKEGLNPYPTAKAQRDDIVNNHHLAIASIFPYTRAGGAAEGQNVEHPILDTSRGGDYDKFRAVHDAFGHAAIGADFTRHGEYQAWLHHSSMFSGAGRRAASTELTGENSFLARSGMMGHPQAAPHKATLLPDFCIAMPWDADGNYDPDFWYAANDPHEVHNIVKRGITAGGFSWNIATGKEPVDGYMVAVQGHSKIVPLDDPNDPAERSKIRAALLDYVKSNMALFKANPNLHLGGWYDVDHGEFVFDPSERVTDRDEAVRLGRERNQQAIWDVANGTEIDTGGTGDREVAKARPWPTARRWLGRGPGSVGGSVPRSGVGSGTGSSSGVSPLRRLAFVKAGPPDEPRDSIGRWVGGASREADHPDVREIPSTAGPPPTHDATPMTDAEYADRAAWVAYNLDKAGARNLEDSPNSTHNIYDNSRGAVGIYTGNRRALHKDIEDEYDARASRVPNDAQAIIMGGLGGAGKSTILRTNAASPDSVAGKLGLTYDTYDSQGNGVGDPNNFIILNPDDIKMELAERGAIPTWQGLSPMENNAFVHEESSHVADILGRKYQVQGKNLIWDITLNSTRSGYKRIKELTDDLGPKYHVAGVFVDVSIPESIANATKRHRKGQDLYNAGIGYGGRYVPTTMQRQSADPSGRYRSKNRAAFEQLKSEGAFDQALTIDNEGYAGKLLEETGRRAGRALTRKNLRYGMIPA